MASGLSVNGSAGRSLLVLAHVVDFAQSQCDKSFVKAAESTREKKTPWRHT